MRLHKGWLDSARICRSEHFNDRPDGEAVSLLVVHNISLPPGDFGGGHVQRFFCGQLDSSLHPYFAEIAHLRVSAHFFIERDGAITQFVSCDERAWHAGASFFGGRDNCNDFSIGVELEGTDQTPYTDAQYAALGELTQALQLAYPAITPYRVTGHEFIAPGRKTDPGSAFDWRRFLLSLTSVKPTA
ncbi:1,6-anhydro-N-acetylmuramyl-L-alanine amidase AmpD [Pseudomonas neustonica]|jgi:AmpD protein|uniref:1,6-anhydro-N-acetylmuramyl-L-alanine amidase AmpD n=1 Tax=Pseudomonas neustonica TaxID=2487346 RepID=A0ABX9XNB1_9PSED|nr:MULTISPECIES: 1,6-anhydro-N-acetylmuramyl-L-alanine amidase AmpD [Pseudomonas]MAB25251.1 1,6-anhydro-N-acetylmuramyl-L-alanine amidase AmpD [Pseudomonadales bacterium]MBA6418523.1 1,6-anhydro-N-acetylmuramyl-L-alanine amidase AmpD [Pseudomonas sp. 5Ae-yellow]ROZ84973.1 1,6-anhydro-N-acetylmuramyl-L-alanine amidase AmpD [Pseudomonas sp. SSM44]ROZ86740.1 1,6-anhydro-N-acetylmuramyl-L-alanine amidase AmpD [Pseudomonas neustonica]|tara:strand:+ start:31814 stop:32374 length:561 start_codon:yes stop_codon:yes gene_type:complete